jgi:hypothetical protein
MEFDKNFFGISTFEKQKVEWDVLEVRRFLFLFRSYEGTWQISIVFHFAQMRLWEDKWLGNFTLKEEYAFYVTL